MKAMDGKQISGRINAEEMLSFLYSNKRYNPRWRLKNEYLCCETSIKTGPLLKIHEIESALSPGHKSLSYRWPKTHYVFYLDNTLC